MNEINEKKFFIVEKKKYSFTHDNYSIHSNNVYDLTTATKILVALDTLNEDRERYSHHLQEVDKGLLPLVLTNEVKEEQSEMPF